MNFNKLIETISQTHEILQQQAVKAINVSLTLRNWKECLNDKSN